MLLYSKAEWGITKAAHGNNIRIVIPERTTFEQRIQILDYKLQPLANFRAFKEKKRHFRGLIRTRPDPSVTKMHIISKQLCTNTIVLKWHST